jgi:putative glycosyltransferase (TIGR04372 family)
MLAMGAIMSLYSLSKIKIFELKYYLTKRIFKKILFITPNLFGILLSPFLVLLIRAIKPIILIRYALILSTRIGHFTENVDLYLCHKKKNLHNSDIKNYEKKIIHLFYCQEDICNKFFLSMLKKKVIILPRFILHWVEQFDSYLDKYFNSERIHEIGCYKKSDPKSFHSNYPPYIQRDTEGLYNDIDSNFEFTSSQITIGNQKLKELGINSKKKIVCIYARDNDYLRKTYPKIDWSHHNYREFDINLFKNTVHYLIEKNYFVIRVGSLANKELKIDNDNFLDYSFSGKVSDFLDVYIPFKCSFFISTSSGIDGFPSLFRKPTLWPSLFPLKDIRSSNKQYMASFRHIKYEETNKKLTMKEVINLDLDYCFDSKDLKNKKVYICPPSEHELTTATKDMVEFLEGSFTEKDDLKLLEKKFKDIFKNSKMAYKDKIIYHNQNKINFKISKSFLESNNWWVE